MLSISLPKSPKYEDKGDNAGVFVIEECYPGYGMTLGNALRRVLLSSLSGAAPVMVKIKGATHEFTTLNGVKEDLVNVVLNLKQVRFKLEGINETVATLKVKGEKVVKAKDIKATSEIQVMNPEQEIATLTSSSAELEMEITVRKGIGYVPIELQDRGEKEIGSIAVDAVFNPVKKVNFDIENMRVGKRTDYDKIIMEVVTDGSISPQEAYQEAVEILMAQFNAISSIATDKEEEVIEEVEEVVEEVKEEKEDTQKENMDQEISSLNLSTRTLNVLEANGLKKVSDIAKYSETGLKDLEGMGEKGIKEIRKAISKFGILLKQNEE